MAKEEEIKDDVIKLRKEVREKYELIGNEFYSVIKKLDEFLEYIENSLSKSNKKEK